MSDTLIKPNISDPESSTEDPIVAHIVKRGEQMEGYILGKELTALCGKKMVPSRDPQGKPICEECKAVWRSIVRRGRTDG
jgi:hypothetical protein